MRIPIDDTTKGFVYEDKFLDIAKFVKAKNQFQDGLITFSEFKKKYNTKSDIGNITKIHDSKDFKFIEPKQ